MLAPGTLHYGSIDVPAALTEFRGTALGLGNTTRNMDFYIVWIYAEDDEPTVNAMDFTRVPPYYNPRHTSLYGMTKWPEPNRAVGRCKL